AGETLDLSRVLKAARRRGIAGKILAIAYPYHSAAVEPLKPGLIADLRGLRGRAGRIPFYSACRGIRCAGTSVNTGYWWDNARKPVAFRTAVRQMLADGAGVLVEISPRPVLAGYLREIAEEAGIGARVLATL